MTNLMRLLLAACALNSGCTNIQPQFIGAQDAPANRSTKSRQAGAPVAGQQASGTSRQNGKQAAALPGAILTGAAALGDWTTDAPGVRRKLTVADLPKPYDTPSARNFPRPVPRPEGAWPRVPQGFKVEEFATGLDNPRKIVVAPSGDVFIAESRPNRLRVLRDADNNGKPEVNRIFAEGLRQPFGIALYPPGPEPQYLYVANTDAVVRFAYRNGDLKASGEPQVVTSNISGGGRLPGGGHWTRDVVFSRDGRKMFLSVGSRSNVDDDEGEARRARIFAFNPDGSSERVYATGIRNPVGLAIHPQTGDLWTSVNERDGLGDHLVPDYVTRVQEGGFYGWPWFYIGGNQDPRHEGKRPELKDKVIVPDVLLQSHMASLAMTFYTGSQFPAEYRTHAFAAQHGSWNRSRSTGYKLVRIPVVNGRATGVYEDFLTGFVTPDGDVWGRPVGVAVARDGSLLVSDDGSGTIWRITYNGAKNGR